MEWHEALQLKALSGYLEPDEDAFFRRVFRFYSKTFHVPLPEVSDIPIEDVLLAFYEEAFEGMDDQEREEHLERLTETDVERQERLKREAAQEEMDDQFFEKLNAEVKEGKRRDLPKERKVKLPPSNLSETARAKAVKNAIKAGVLQGKPAPPPEPKPDIHMSFSDGNLETEVGEQDPLGPPPKKAR